MKTMTKEELIDALENDKQGVCVKVDVKTRTGDDFFYVQVNKEDLLRELKLGDVTHVYGGRLSKENYMISSLIFLEKE